MPTTPTTPVDLFIQWFWLVAIAGSFINAGIYYTRSRRHLVSQPELATSYGTLIKGYLVWSNIPWVVMGAVVLLGEAESVFDFLSPRERGTGVVIWYASVGLVWAAAAFWILFLDGDVVIAKHRAFLSSFIPRSPYMIRLFTIFMFIIGVIAFMVLWSGHIRFPAHR